ncbi:DUF2975 domain-containing protein [Phyllobacterium sp. 628]|uniref:DUF2975 domain-containing protein n=1 Tax=Phyllobacterium sp. 628 TaxID=2718938 RepID=UPI0016622721|nr:DUF2975 domain-containing protein [Phyllobacterium sp. 628]QND51339.1 DUF2975 domain-containing protein [Phyllobacterium sp. 628]
MSDLSTPDIMHTGLGQSRRAERIRLLSRIMSGLYAVTAIALFGGMLYYWFATLPADILSAAGLPLAGADNFGFGTRLLGLIISMTPLAVLIWGLLQARRCFNSFASGKFFTLETIRSLRAFALAVFISTLLQFFAETALSVALSWTNPAGQRTLSIGISSNMLLGLLFAGTITIMAWVMTEAVAIADENAQFV